MLGTLRMSVPNAQQVIKDYSQLIKNANCFTKNVPSSGFAHTRGVGVLNGFVDSKWANRIGEQWHHMWVANLTQWCQAEVHQQELHFTQFWLNFFTIPFSTSHNQDKFSPSLWIQSQNQPYCRVGWHIQRIWLRLLAHQHQEQMYRKIQI